MARRLLNRARAHAALAIFVGFAAPGCAASVGPTAHYEPTARAFSAGAGISSLLYVSRGRGVLSRGEGPVVGIETEALSRVTGADPGEDTFSLQGALLLGWSVAPMPYRKSPVGYEVVASVGAGRVPVGGRLETAGAFGARLGLPIRLSHPAAPWRQDHPLGLEVFAVPQLATALHLPVSGAPPGADFSLGVALRVHLWSALLP